MEHDSRNKGDLYCVLVSGKNIKLLKITRHDKKLMVDILKGEVNHDLTSNPIRDMIVEGMISGSPFEIWQVNSELSEQEIMEAFILEGDLIKHEIRSTGELLFAN
jgi:hypothetical protein